MRRVVYYCAFLLIVVALLAQYHVLAQSRLAVGASGLGASMQVTPSGGHTVALAWTETSTGVTDYNVYRSTSISGPFSVIGTSPMTAYTDTNPPVGSVSYEVTALMESGPSNVATVTVPSSPSAKFTVGQQVAVSNTGGARLNVRYLPSMTAPVFRTEAPTATATVLYGPVAVAGNNWWVIEFADTIGACREDYLQ